MSVPAHVMLPPGPAAEPTEVGRTFGVVHRFLRSRGAASAWYLVPMLGLVAFATALVAFAFAQAPVPPGVDPGHWLAISYGYVGLPTAPDPANQVLFYSPLMFPFLGGLVLATGNPLVAADLLGIGLFLLYGLSVVHLARRFLTSGPLQVALVGFAVLSGSTIQMLFWGGYPNLLGFVLMNEALVAMLAFVRSKRTRDGALMYAFLGLTYFGHDLSALELFSIFVVVTLFLLLTRKVALRFVLHRANLIGLAAVGVAIVGFSEVTARLGISHPSYFTANPAAYFIDNVGELFSPLGRAPAALPIGTPLYLPPLPTAALLALAPLVALLSVLVLAHLVPGRADTRLVIAAGWLSAALAVPGIGYLAHVDTDYTRLLYFLPLPFFLVALLAVERGFASTFLPAPVAPPRLEPGAGPSISVAPPWRPSGPAPRAAFAFTSITVAIALLAVAAFVTVPVTENNQAASTAVAHDAPFLQAERWLHANPRAGTVLTVPSSARWTEALTERNALTVGPVWLLFDPFQVTQSQETYWALCSQYTLVSPQSALSFSGFATSAMSQAPMYTPYIEGVPFPAVRLPAGNLELNASGPGGVATYPLAGGPPPVLVAPGSPGGALTVVYTTPVAKVVETGTTSPDGSATVTFRVSPDPGVSVSSLTVGLTGPPANSTTLATDTIDSSVTRVTGLTVDVSGKLGQYPDRVHLNTTVGFSVAPRWETGKTAGPSASWNAVVPDSNGSSPFGVTLEFSSPGASRPASPLPPLLSTPTFLTNQSIAFLLWPNRTYGSVELTYYEATFGFRPEFQNSEWVILGR
ncbi:MAG: hypothetical protein L3K05_03035 [Thermoplasmata archaeon]|nr:hypothetical protein [Thermoplasmata archaeon]